MHVFKGSSQLPELLSQSAGRELRVQEDDGKRLFLLLTCGCETYLHIAWGHTYIFETDDERIVNYAT